MEHLSAGGTEGNHLTAQQNLQQVLQGSYLSVKDAHNLEQLPPFCIVAVLSNAAEKHLVESFKKMIKGMRDATSAGFPLYVSTYVMENVSDSFRASLRSAFEVEGKFSLPSFYVTINDPEHGFKGNVLDWSKLKHDNDNMTLLREEMMNTCLQAAHMMARRYIEMGESVWWKDPLKDQVAAAEATPAETLEERSKRLREESLRKFEEARKQGYEVAGKKLKKKKKMDPLTSAMAHALKKEGNLHNKSKQSAQKLLDAVRLGDTEAAATELLRKDLADWQKEALLEMLPEKVANEMVEHVESVTDAYLHNMRVEINDLLLDIRKFKKLKGERRAEMKREIRHRANRMKNMPLELLEGDLITAGLSRLPELKALWDRINFYNKLAAKSGEPFAMSWSGIVVESVAAVLGTNDPCVKAISLAAQAYTLAQNIPISKAMVCNSIMHMSAQIHLDAAHANLLGTLSRPDGLLRSLKDVIMENNGKVFEDFVQDVRKVQSVGFANDVLGQTQRFTYETSVRQAAEKHFGAALKKSVGDAKARNILDRLAKDMPDNQRTAALHQLQERLAEDSFQHHAKSMSKTYQFLVGNGNENARRALQFVEDAMEGKKTFAKIGEKLFTSAYAWHDQYIGLMTLANGVAKMGKLAGLSEGWVQNTWATRGIKLLAVGTALGYLGPVSTIVALSGKLTASIKLLGMELDWYVWVGALSLCKIGCLVAPKHCKKITRWKDSALETAHRFRQKLNEYAPTVALTLSIVTFVEVWAGAAAAETTVASIVAFLTSWSPVSYVGVTVVGYVKTIPVVVSAGNFALALTGSVATGLGYAATSVASGVAFAVTSPTIVVGVLAVGGIYWLSKKAYSKTKKHLRAGGQILMPAGWRMFVHDETQTLWFANRKLGRLQTQYPTGTQFVDANGKRTAHTTIALGIMRPTKLQKSLAIEMGRAMEQMVRKTHRRMQGGATASLGNDARQLKHLLAKWRSTNPRNGARLLAERHILRGVLGAQRFQRLTKAKVLECSHDDPVATAILEELSAGKQSVLPARTPVAQIVRSVGRDAMYHAALSLQAVF